MILAPCALLLSANAVQAQAINPVTGLPQVEQSEPGIAVEQGRDYPFFDLELGTEIGLDSGLRSDDPANEIEDAFAEAALAITLGLTPIFSVNIGLTLERTTDAAGGGDVYFENIGLYADTLNLQADIGAFTFYGGKFGPSFGTAWDITLGVYGTDFAEDYELSEQLGFGAAYTLETITAGNYTLGANIFAIDTTFLSESVFDNRGHTRLADGGAGNTEKLNNVSITLDAGDFPDVEGLSFNLGYRHLAKGVDSISDENGYVFGVAYEMEHDGTAYAVTGEVAHFDGLGGTSTNATYFTAGMFVQHGAWHAELSGGLRNSDNVADEDDPTIFTDIDDRFIQVSAGYEFENGLDLSAGLKFSEEENTSTTTAGIRLTKAFTYSSDGLGFEE
jgi:hypothetical protein